MGQSKTAIAKRRVKLFLIGVYFCKGVRIHIVVIGQEFGIRLGLNLILIKLGIGMYNIIEMWNYNKIFYQQ